MTLRTAGAQRRNENIDVTIEAIGKTMTMMNAGVQGIGRGDIVMIETDIAAITADTGRDHTAQLDLGLAAHLHEDRDGLHHLTGDDVHTHPGHAIDRDPDPGHRIGREMIVVIQKDIRDARHLQGTIRDQMFIEPRHGRSLLRRTLPLG